MSETKVKGTVKWFSKIKGIGFITNDKGEDIFVHFSKIDQESKILYSGDKVQYVTGTNKKGPAAVNVEVLDVRL